MSVDGTDEPQEWMREDGLMSRTTPPEVHGAVFGVEVVNGIATMWVEDDGVWTESTFVFAIEWAREIEKLMKQVRS